MTRISFFILACLSLMLTLQSCELIGDIFEAGVWVGVLLVVVVIVGLIWLLSRFRRK